MSEYIITEKQLKTATEAYSEREVPLPITNVFISGDKLPEIVRCRDCSKSIGGEQCMRHKSSGWSGNTWVDEYEQVDPDGYCAWGERRDA